MLRGRRGHETRPGFRGALLVTSNEYNTANQLVATRSYAVPVTSSPSPLTFTLICYNSLGQRTLTVSDMNRNNQIDWSDTDRIVSNDTRYVSLNGDWWRESSTWQTRQNGSPALTRVGLTRTRLTGHDGRARPPASPQGFLLSETHSYAPLNAVVRQSFVWDPTEPVATRPLAWFGSNAPPRLYTHDGNKNVSEVVVAASGTNAAVEVVAHYDYAAFGAVIAQKGGCAETNPWRFSSEYEDTELGLDYYNYRHYEPETGRWLQRDLIESKETAQFVGNSPVDKNDRIGLYGNPVSGGGKRYPNRPENWGFDGSAYDECPDGAKVKSLGDGSLAFFRTDIDNFKEKECNGCGAKGGQKFPDSYMGLVDFTGCCNDHDICYGTCGRDKGVCDKNLGDCMRSKCEQALKYVYHEKVLCKTMADAYEKAVSDWGNSAFEAGQDSGCIWRPCCKKK